MVTAALGSQDQQVFEMGQNKTRNLRNESSRKSQKLGSKNPENLIKYLTFESPESIPTLSPVLS